MLIINFVIIPFTYFYGEERNDFMDLDFEKESKIEKILTAIKYTFFFILFTGAFLIIGLIFRPGREKGIEKGKEVEWIKQLFDVEHVGESAIYFCIGVLTCIGTFCWSIYTAYGLAHLPYVLIKGEKSLKETKEDLTNDLGKIRQKYRTIQEKYLNSHTKISRSDQRILNNLKKQERLISFRSEKISLVETNLSSLQMYIITAITPFRVGIGMVALGLSFIISSSLISTTLDKLLNSKCGFPCGYLIENQTFYNPIDKILVFAADYFPLDYIFFFVIMFYIYLSCFYAICKLGIRFICLTIYEIKKETTVPQALLTLVFLMNLLILAIGSQLMVLTPQYFTFGNQTYNLNNQKKMCNLNAIDSSKAVCKMSNLSAYFTKISVSLPFFSVIFFCANVVFLIVNIFSNFFAIFSKKKGKFDVI